MINKSLIMPSVGVMVLAVLILFSAVNAIAVTSMFDSGLGGWTSNTPAEISWSSSGGFDDSGYVRFEDASFNGTQIYAPASFLGNWSGLDGIEGAITYQHKIFQVGVNPTFLPYRIEISGPGGTASWEGETPSGTTGWVPVSASLREEDWVVSAGSWSTLLSDVTQFKILIEGVSNGGPGLDLLDITGIDYVILAAGIGACCLPDGSCTEGTVEECEGRYMGDGTNCASTECSDAPLMYIDIKPGSCPNPMKVNRDGVLPIAILGTEMFDVTHIDPLTIMVTRDGIDDYVVPLRSSYKDVAEPFEGEECDCHEENGDGYQDLTFKFDRKDLAETLKLWQLLGQTVPLTVTGNLLEEHGGTPITGQDCVLVKPKVIGEAKLEPIGESGVYGKARLVTRKNGTTKVVLERFSGLTPGETYAAHIRSGSCGGDNILFSLNDVIVDAEGIGRSVTIVGAKIDFDDWWIEVGELTCGKVELR